MAPKKAGKSSKKTVHEERPAIVFPPMTYLVEDINTTLSLLASHEYKIRLRALVTLNKYINDEGCMNIFLSKGIYRYLCNLLADEDVFILRFSLKMLSNILTNSKYLNEINFNEVFACLKPTLHLYLEKEDTFILESSSLIMVQILKHNELFAVHSFSLKLIQRLFDKMMTTKDVDIQKNAVELLYYLLQIQPAEEELSKTEILSIDVLLCLLKSEIDVIKDLTINIFITVASWRNKDVLIKLTEKKLNEAMVNLIMNEDKEEYCVKAFEIIKLCMSMEECALHFCKTFEFIAFSEWVKFCPTHFIEPSAEILTILTKTPEIREIMFDLSIEDTIVHLFRYAHEPIYILACEAISNMTTYKYCCEKVVTPSLISMLLDILKTPLISMVCLEAVVKTLHNFLKRNTNNTLRIIVKLNCFDLLFTLHEAHEDEISHECVEMILEMTMFCCKSKYLDEICDFKLYEMLLHLYEHDRHVLKVLNILNKLIAIEEFRKYFLEMNGPNILLNGLENSNCPILFAHVLIVVQNLIPHKNIALAFLDDGLLTFLNSVNSHIKNKVRIIGDVIELLYNLCLSLKFFDKGRLEITDHLRDTFYLVHDDWFVENTSVESQDERPVVRRPIYSVNYNLLKQVCSSEVSNITGCLPESTTETTKRNKGFIEKDIELTCTAIHLKQIRNISQFSSECVNSQTKEPAINYGESSDDPYLVDYVMEVYNRFFTSENAIKSFQGRVQFLAEYVDRQMSGLEETDDVKRKQHLFQTHLMSLRLKLGSNLVPIGYLRMGYHCERALLYKVLADNLGLPVTLSKGNDGIYWNEVAFLHKTQDSDEHEPVPLQSNEFVYYVIDLMNDIGNLMPVGSVEALKYCHLHSIKKVISPEFYQETK